MAVVVESDIKVQEAQTARHLAIALSCALGANILLQYLALTVLAISGRQQFLPEFEHLFNAWLPVISGLTGSAVTYYLTKRPTHSANQQKASGGEGPSELEAILPCGGPTQKSHQLVMTGRNFQEDLTKDLLETLDDKFAVIGNPIHTTR